MIKIKSKNKTQVYQLVKWLLFVPSLVGLLVYVFAFLVELFSIKGKTSEHTKKDVCNARKWFIYLAFPFFNVDYFVGLVYNMSSDELRKMYEVYGTRKFNKRLKMYVPFVGQSLNAFDAVHAKNNLVLEIKG